MPVGRNKTPEPNPDSPWLDRREVAAYLRIAPNSVDNLVRRGVLTRHRVKGMTNQALYHIKEVTGIVVPTEWGEMRGKAKQEREADGK